LYFRVEFKNKQLFVVKDSNPETVLLSEMKYRTPNKSKIDQNYKKKMINNVITGDVYSIQDYVTGQWFSPGTPVSSINKSYSHDITELLLKVALNIITSNTIFNIKSAVLQLYMRIIHQSQR
jgi:hypothetical protein